MHVVTYKPVSTGKKKKGCMLNEYNRKILLSTKIASCRVWPRGRHLDMSPKCLNKTCHWGFAWNLYSNINVLPVFAHCVQLNKKQPVTVHDVLHILRPHVSVPQCDVFGYLSIDHLLVVLIAPVDQEPTPLQVTNTHMLNISCCCVRTCEPHSVLYKSRFHQFEFLLDQLIRAIFHWKI